MMKKTQCDKKMALLNNQVSMLMQNFDSIQIFATKYNHDTGDTATFVTGGGPYPSRFGQINEWMLSNTAEVIARKIRNEGERE